MEKQNVTTARTTSDLSEKAIQELDGKMTEIAELLQNALDESGKSFAARFEPLEAAVLALTNSQKGQLPHSPAAAAAKTKAEARDALYAAVDQHIANNDKLEGEVRKVVHIERRKLFASGALYTVALGAAVAAITTKVTRRRIANAAAADEAALLDNGSVSVQI